MPDALPTRAAIGRVEMCLAWIIGNRGDRLHQDAGLGVDGGGLHVHGGGLHRHRGHAHSNAHAHVGVRVMMVMVARPTV
jgi:hypothetical protein